MDASNVNKKVIKKHAEKVSGSFNDAFQLFTEWANTKIVTHGLISITPVECHFKSDRMVTAFYDSAVKGPSKKVLGYQVITDQKTWSQHHQQISKKVEEVNITLGKVLCVSQFQSGAQFSERVSVIWYLKDIPQKRKIQRLTIKQAGDALQTFSNQINMHIPARSLFSISPLYCHSTNDCMITAHYDEQYCQKQPYTLKYQLFKNSEDWFTHHQLLHKEVVNINNTKGQVFSVNQLQSPSPSSKECMSVVWYFKKQTTEIKGHYLRQKGEFIKAYQDFANWVNTNVHPRRLVSICPVYVHSNNDCIITVYYSDAPLKNPNEKLKLQFTEFKSQKAWPDHHKEAQQKVQKINDEKGEVFSVNELQCSAPLFKFCVTVIWYFQRQ